GSGQWAAGWGRPALVRRQSTRTQAWRLPAAAGILVPAMAWAVTPGPGGVAVPGLAGVACCDRGRRTCGRSARPRTTTPAGSRAVRSCPRRCRCAPGRTLGRRARPRTTRGAWTDGAGFPAYDGGRAVGTAVWASTPLLVRLAARPCPG